MTPAVRALGLVVWVHLAAAVPIPPRPIEKPAESAVAWGLPQELLRRLAEQARLYEKYAIRFTCYETARVAEYDGLGQASSEHNRRLAYLLVRDGQTIREYRSRINAEGRPAKATVDDEEPFPPAYAWVFLFSEFNRPYFAYRDLGDRFEGFDWVRVIEFRGALSFTDGKDIRQWEGQVLVDAVTLTPLEIHAQPRGQDQRIQLLYERWARSFNLIGFRLGPKPVAFRSHAQFRYRRDGLTFPTELRYDTLRAVSTTRTVMVRASTRVYDGYRFFEPRTEEPEYRVPTSR
jgi:hypothetical protein